jgi:hypothetical protein
MYALLEPVEALHSSDDTWNGSGVKLLSAGTEEHARTLRHRVVHSPHSRTYAAIRLTETTRCQQPHVFGCSKENALLHSV